MKNHFLINLITTTALLFLSAFFLFSCNGTSNKKVTWNPEMANNLKEIRAGFESPPVDFSTTPFWVWNDKVTKEKIEFQLKEFKDKGIYMAFIHPRPGLITEYLGEEWFELISFAVQKAKELGMKVWLYDENSYPSGFAGGHVPAATFSRADPVAGLRLHRLEKLVESDTNQYFVVIKQVGNSFANITRSRSKYFDQPGKYYAFTKWYYPEGEAWFGGFSYVDLLAYGITEKFISLTMDGYEDYIGDEFGKTVPGIFTDEPNVNTRGGDKNVIRFTPVLFNRFETKYGYQLSNYLPCLYDEIGDWKNVRHDYYALLLEMFLERWGKPWYEYTEEKNLNWTGHYWEHGWPDPKHGGDNMAMYAYHQYPGIDMLFNTDTRPDQFGNIRAVKELSSVVNQLDKPRALSETYGGAGWELTFEDMKRLGDWEYVLGVNLLNQHLSHMTLKGARKRDYPQSMSYHASWWDNYKPLNEYFHRLSFAMSAGKQVNRILVLEPTSTAWMLHSPIQERKIGNAERPEDMLKNQFEDLLSTLEKHQVEYDLGCESIISSHGSVDQGKFIVGHRGYDLVVIPPLTENLMDSTFILLERYLSAGGKVVSLAGIPLRIDGNRSNEKSELLGKYANQWVLLDEVNEQAIGQYFSENSFQANSPENWGGEVFHHRRQLQDGQLIFFTNYDKEETANISFSAKGRSILELDPLTGGQCKLEANHKDGFVNLEFELSPAGSLLIIIGEKEIDGDACANESKSEPQEIETSELMIQRLNPNTLTLDYCDLSIQNQTYKDLYFYNAADTIYKHYLKEIYGYNYNPWSNAVQYRTRILDKNDFGDGSGFEVKYRFSVKAGEIPPTLRAVVEWPELYEVSINGEPISPMENEWWLDKSFGVFDLQKFAKSGENVLSVSATPMDILAEVEPVYLIGEFGVIATEKGFQITEVANPILGSWKTQPYPFYSHDMSYKKTFTAKKGQQVEVTVDDWAGAMISIKVNGNYAGIIGWPPYRLDISDFLNDGENEVDLVVTGNLKNLMGPHHFKPLPGFVTPWSFFRGPADQPPGTEYDLLDYGLFEDFKIQSVN